MTGEESYINERLDHLDIVAGMAALTGAMVIEKTVPGGKRLSPFIGIVLLLLGVLWLAHPVWLQRAGI